MTNIIILNLAGHRLDAMTLASAAHERGLVIGTLGAQLVRIITHLDVSDVNAEFATKVLVDLLR
jgi:threonine aldolase